MTRPELEARAAALSVYFLSTDSDETLAENIAWMEAELRSTRNEQIADERDADDWAGHAE